MEDCKRVARAILSPALGGKGMPTKLTHSKLASAAKPSSEALKHVKVSGKKRPDFAPVSETIAFNDPGVNVA
ncbi:hypothetical protein APSETT445_000499 [Aspergillus pseudonomiae]